MKIGQIDIGRARHLIDIPLIEVLREGTYLTFPAGTDIAAGDMLWIVRPIGLLRGSVFPLLWGRRIVATVSVVGRDGGDRFRVRVLAGSVTRGIWGQKPA